jgi:hypothetical protein
MQPITRETIIDRRQPAIRWSAVLAGTAVAVGLWGVFQLLGIGAGLVALDPDDAMSARGTALGIGAWSVLAPLIATLVGGFVAAKLANTYDRRIAGAHGFVVWGLTAIAGLVATLWMAKVAAVGAMHAGAGDRHEMTHANAAGANGYDANRDAQDALMPINQRLRLQGKAQITPDQLIKAAREAIKDDQFDNDKFVEELDDETALSRDEAKDVATQLGPRAQSLAQRMPAATPTEHDAMDAAKNAGKGLLALAVSILLSIGTAILGAMLALRRFGKDKDDRGREIREREVHTTAPYPATPVTPADYPPTTTTPGV